MAYDEDLAFALRGALEGIDGITTKRMFGGMAFLLDGHLVVAASGRGGLMARIDPADVDEVLRAPETSRMEMGGRELDGWIRVTAEGCDAPADLQRWVDRSLAFVRTLSPKA